MSKQPIKFTTKVLQGNDDVVLSFISFEIKYRAIPPTMLPAPTHIIACIIKNILREITKICNVTQHFKSKTYPTLSVRNNNTELGA